MGEGLKDVFHGDSLFGMDAAAAAAAAHAHELTEDSSSFFGGGGDSNSSMHSSQEDLTDDASSSSPASNASHGPLYGLSSSLMAELPIKRGLSSFFDGKSQSFTSLMDAKCVEDLAKKQQTPPFSKRMKSSKSYAGGLDGNTRPCYAPGVHIKAIAKKTYRSSCAFLMSRRRRRRSSSNLLYKQ